MTFVVFSMPCSNCEIVPQVREYECRHRLTRGLGRLADPQYQQMQETVITGERVVRIRKGNQVASGGATDMYAKAHMYTPGSA